MKKIVLFLGLALTISFSFGSPPDYGLMDKSKENLMKNNDNDLFQVPTLASHEITMYAAVPVLPEIDVSKCSIDNSYYVEENNPVITTQTKSITAASGGILRRAGNIYSYTYKEKKYLIPGKCSVKKSFQPYDHGLVA